MADNRLPFVWWPYYSVVCIHSMVHGLCFYPSFITFLSFSLPYLLVGFIFSCHCVPRVYFPTEFRVSQNSSCSAPSERCLFSLPVRQICKSCVFEGLREERDSGPESRFLMTPAKSVCFQICHTTIPETPAHTLSRTHCAQSSLRKQAAAITRAQTGPVGKPVLTSQAPGWRTTVLLYITEHESPQKVRKTHLTFFGSIT